MSDSLADKIVEGLRAQNAGADVLAFVLNNSGTFCTLGIEAAAQITTLVNSGQMDSARMLLDLKLDPDGIIARENANAEELLEVTIERERFIAELKAFGWTLAPLLIKIGAGLATGGVL